MRTTLDDGRLDPINHNIGKRRDYEFAGAGGPAHPTAIGEIFQAGATVEDDFGHLPRRFGVVAADAVYDMLQVLGRLRRPANFDQDPRSRSMRLPISACVTNSPRSSEAKPFSTASMKSESSSRYRARASRTRSSALRPSRAASSASRVSWSTVK